MDPWSWEDLRAFVYSGASAAKDGIFTKEDLFRGLLLPALDADKTSLLCKGIKILPTNPSSDSSEALIGLVKQVCAGPQTTSDVLLVCMKELTAIELNSSLARAVIDCGLARSVVGLVGKAGSGLYDDAKRLIVRWSDKDIGLCRDIMHGLEHVGNSKPDSSSDLQQDEIALRVLECTVEICSLSPDHFGIASPSLKLLFDEIRDGDDILLLMNVIPMVAQLASTAPGLTAVCSKEHGCPIIECLFNFVTNADSGLLECSMLAIAEVCAAATLNAVDGDLMDRFLAGNLQVLQEVTSTDDKCVAFEALSLLCMKAPHALAKIAQMPGLLDAWFRIDNDNDTLVPQINSIRLALFPPDLDGKGHFYDEACLDKTRQAAFAHIKDRRENSPSHILLELMQHRNKMAKFAAYELIKSGSCHEWFAKQLIIQPKFLSIILDRSTESCETGLSLKYNVLQNLSTFPDILGIFAESVNQYLQKGR